MDVIDWLLDSDPALRWQVLRDLTDAPAEQVAAERARVAHEGWGAELLAAQGADGRWSGGTFFPEWISTAHAAGAPRAALGRRDRLVTSVAERTWADAPTRGRH